MLLGGCLYAKMQLQGLYTRTVYHWDYQKTLISSMLVLYQLYFAQYHLETNLIAPEVDPGIGVHLVHSVEYSEPILLVWRLPDGDHIVQATSKYRQKTA